MNFGLLGAYDATNHRHPWLIVHAVRKNKHPFSIFRKVSPAVGVASIPLLAVLHMS